MYDIFYKYNSTLRATLHEIVTPIRDLNCFFDEL